MSCDHQSRNETGLRAILRRLGFGILLLGLLAGSATARVQSPRALSAAPIKRPAVSASLPPSPNQSTASAASTAAAVSAPTNRPVIASFAWDASTAPGITNYSLWWGITSRTYTNSARFSTNLTGSLSNVFVRGLRYYVAATAQDNTGAVSPFSAEVLWPPFVTNYVLVGIKTNGRPILQLIYPNPPGDVVLFEPFILQTNDFVAVTRLSTGALKISNQ